MKKTALAALVTASVIVPTAAHATFLPGTEPDPQWNCGAGSGRLGIAGECRESQRRHVASRSDLYGAILVSSKGVDLAFDPLPAGGTATASVASAQVANLQLNVRIEGARVTETGACSTEDPNHYGAVYDGTVHVDRLTINGTTYEQIDGFRQFVVPGGTVTVGGTWRDYYENSFDAMEGEARWAVQVTIGNRVIPIGMAQVGAYGFPC